MDFISSSIDMICLYMLTSLWLPLLEKPLGNNIASAVVINFSVSSLWIAGLAIQFNDFIANFWCPKHLTQI